MDELLRDGQKLTAVPGGKITVSDKLGSGGQGTVYRVNTSSGDRALKWYFRSAATPTQREIIERLVDMGTPDDRFLWPTALVLGDRADAGFGYLMDLRPANYVGLPAIFRRRVGTTPRALVTACIEVVEAYRTLHSKGIAYRDISWGNVFLDPKSGEALVCDNDNVMFEGHQTEIIGTMMFMAPELVRMDAGVQPGTQTDLHALAVLLFMMLMNAHPLEGKLEYEVHCMDLQAQKKLYGFKPVFVFDPDNRSNRPVPGEHDTVMASWKAAPQSLKRIFADAFTKGLHHPNERVREWQWLETLSRLRDAIVYCAKCNRQNYHDEIAFEKTGKPGVCWKCRTPLVLPPRMSIGNRLVMLNRDAEVYEHQLTHTPLHDFSTVIGAVVPHPRKAGRYGMTNKDEHPWTAMWPDGTTKTVARDQTVPLRVGLRLRIRGVEAEIRASKA